MSLVYAAALANQKVAAIRNFYIKTASEKWQSLGRTKDGKLTLTVVTSDDGVARNTPVTVDIACTFKMMQSRLTEIYSMGSICDGSNSFLMEQADADTSTYLEGYGLLTNLQVGAKAKLVVPASPDQDRYIEITLAGNVPISSFDAILGPTVALADFQAAASTTAIYGLIGSSGSTGVWTGVNLGHPEGVHGGGIASIQLSDALAAGYVTLGGLRNGTFEAEFVGEGDELKRTRTTGVMITLVYEHLETLQTGGLSVQDTWNRTQMDVKVTLPDGVVGTFESKLGFNSIVDFGGKVDEHRVIKNTHKGWISKRSFDECMA